MNLQALKTAVESHAGTFLCERINRPAETKVVHFAHAVGQPDRGASVPAVGRLPDFLDTFGSIVFYEDAVSGDAAVHLAPPSAWAALDDDFRDWVEPLGEDEKAEILPAWAERCLVIGEEPRTGNYLLMPLEGEEAGAVYLFDHDGYEFTREAADVIEYVEKMLAPDDGRLTGMASHMRFIDGDPRVQWWIRELRDNRGHTASTRA